jgi:hypothetical protein
MRGAHGVTPVQVFINIILTEYWLLIDCRSPSPRNCLTVETLSRRDSAEDQR